MPIGSKMGFTKQSYSMKPPTSINFDFSQKVGDGAMTKTGKNDGTVKGNAPGKGAPPSKY
jgi:hypothetical protein